ncbi:MAG TPA: SIS domain-containing protein [bacterium]|nr:SIS domain-containing protein [bacterium]
MTVSVSDRLADYSGAFDLLALDRHVAEEMSHAWAAALPADRARGLRRLVISGCGDSLFAGVAARLAIERFGGISCEPMEALECGRYAAVRFSPEVAVLGVSNSGTTSFVLESIAAARQAGAVTVALAGAAGSPLERLAGAGVVRPVVGAGGRTSPTARAERHLGEYLGTLMALYHLALYLGVARGVITERDRREQAERVRAAAEMAQQALRDGPGRVAAVLGSLRDSDRIYFVAAGPAYGTALFGAAKLVEEIPLCSVPQQLEEWAHLQYFQTMVEGPRTRAVVIAPPGEATDRAAEILRSIRDDGGFALAVTHSDEAAVREAASAAITVDGDCWEGYAPIPYAIPVQLLDLALALEHGQSVIPLSRRDGGRLIRGSRVVRANVLGAPEA